MPPIMGAAAFIIAEFLGMTYTNVMMAAVIPAFACYLSLFFYRAFREREAWTKGHKSERISLKI